ncbi:MAG TPA: S8 family peptidase [Puia sp.]
MKATFLISLILVFGQFVHAQSPNWQNLDLQKDSVFGISTEKAYAELLQHKQKKKKYKPVLVAVIDGGVDTSHEDLKSLIWINPKEIAGNGLDDDHDGYSDDVHGWDFIGGSKGDIDQENLELTRLIRKGEFTADMLEEYQKQVRKDSSNVRNIKSFERVLDGMTAKMKKDSPSLSDFQSYTPEGPGEKQIKQVMIQVLQQDSDFTAFRENEIEDAIKHFQTELDYHLNISFNPRAIVGDDSTNAEEHLYGNNDVTGPDALHGTHVAGIIGAERNNNIGIRGVADRVRIMSVRTVPDGDERDKDVASAIRFATDHGARVINMSFGKGYSPNKKVVDEAVKYAMSKDVLIVHAAGNEGENLDHESNFPNRTYADSSGAADAWIEVGASGWKNDFTLVAPFSNYGRNTVDVFAPGVKIRSTIPGSKYIDESGTSMASPVVAGLAALIREYYPKLKASEVKDIIMKSVVKPTQNVTVKDGRKALSLHFSEVCVSGGVVNAYNALSLAKHYKGK